MIVPQGIFRKLPSTHGLDYPYVAPGANAATDPYLMYYVDGRDLGAAGANVVNWPTRAGVFAAMDFDVTSVALIPPTVQAAASVNGLAKGALTCSCQSAVAHLWSGVGSDVWPGIAGGFTWLTVINGNTVNFNTPVPGAGSMTLAGGCCGFPTLTSFLHGDGNHYALSTLNRTYDFGRLNRTPSEGILSGQQVQVWVLDPGVTGKARLYVNNQQVPLRAGLANWTVSASQTGIYSIFDAGSTFTVISAAWWKTAFTQLQAQGLYAWARSQFWN